MPLIRKRAESNMLGEGILVETDQFNHREVKPHFINSCCFGEDFAAWLKQELSQGADLGFEFSKLIQEDYGWGFWALRDKERFWVAISYVGDGPQEPPAQWLISVNSAFSLPKRLFHRTDRLILQQLHERVWHIIKSNDKIKPIKI